MKRSPKPGDALESSPSENSADETADAPSAPEAETAASQKPETANASLAYLSVISRAEWAEPDEAG